LTEKKKREHLFKGEKEERMSPFLLTDLSPIILKGKRVDLRRRKKG